MGAGLGSRDGPSAWPGHAQPVPGSSVDLPMSVSAGFPPARARQMAKTPFCWP
jgi:hypothetical protein